MSYGIGVGIGLQFGSVLAAAINVSAQTGNVGQTPLAINMANFFAITPTSYAVNSGSLPGGLALNTSTGAITGAYTAAGSFSVTVRATDSGGTTQDSTVSWTIGEWYAAASAAYDTSDTTGSPNVTAINDLVGSQDLSLRGSNHATIAGSVVSFTQANNVAYNTTVTSQLGSGNAYAQGFSGTITSASNAFTIPIARSQATTGAHYARIDLDAGGAALQVDPLVKDASTTVRQSDADETDVLATSSAELSVLQVAADDGEVWAFYQGLPIAYDRRDSTATVLSNTISDSRVSLLGHTASTPNTSWTGTFDGAFEVWDTDSPTPALAARIAGSLAGKSGNFVARPGIAVAAIGNSLGAGSSPAGANREATDLARGFSVLDLTADDTQYFGYHLRAPIDHTVPAAWVTSTAYSNGDYVTESAQIYYCLQDHTGGTFATDLANNLWVRVQGRETNLSGWDHNNNIGRADPQAYMLNQIIADSDAFVVYGAAHASGACLARETASDNGGIDYWLSASDAGGSGRTSLWDAHVAKLQKVFEVADATPAMHSTFKVLSVGCLGGQEARGASNYAGGSNIITPAQYKTYLEAFVSRAFSALGIDMILYAPASVDLDYVNESDYGIFAEFRAVENEVAAANPRFIMGCPGHIDPGVNPDFTVDGDGAWASSVASGGTQIHIGTPGSGDPLHWSAAYHRAQGRYDAALVLAEWRRQMHGA